MSVPSHTARRGPNVVRKGGEETGKRVSVAGVGPLRRGRLNPWLARVAWAFNLVGAAFTLIISPIQAGWFWIYHQRSQLKLSRRRFFIKVGYFQDWLL
ncbi:hypothetical protein ACLOJK_004489, partial [Asimina triloba]